MKRKQLFFILVMSCLIFTRCNESSPSLDLDSTETSPTSEQSIEGAEEITDSSNLVYVSSRIDLNPIDLKQRIKSINDTLILPFDLMEKYGSVHVNFGLLDINGDDHLDLIAEYYRTSGSGVKNRVDIFLFDKRLNKLSSEPFALDNPSYYENDIITSHYYGMGGGSAVKYQIVEKQFIPIEKISINIDQHDTGIIVDFAYSQKPFDDTVHTSDFMVRLPREYLFVSLFEKEK